MSTITDNSAGSRKRKFIAIGGILLVVFGLAFGFQTGAIRTELQRLKLWPAPNPYTELYFDNQLILPNDADAQPVVFKFGVHNMENKTVTYPYVITLVSAAGSTKTLGTGSVTLANGQTANVPEVLQLPVTPAREEVVVTLPDQQQSVHFWMEGK